MPLSQGGGAAAAATLANGQLVLTTGNITSASASFTDLTGVTLTVTTGARRCLVGFSCVCTHSSATIINISFDLAIDGTRQGGTAGLTQGSSSTSNNGNPSFVFLTAVLTAASHTFKIQWLPASATGTVFASATAPAVLWVAETSFTT